ncbi:MAG: ABC-2 family transporter protein [Clostridia bacterium]|nr:ABC-2 family transporter protein [Clostridia bacterium]
MSTLMEAKNLARVLFQNYKYALMASMLNKASFITYIVFMMLNNACFLIQWVVVFSIKSSVCGLTFKEVILVWAIASSSYGFARFFFTDSFTISDYVIKGKLDAYLVQPKNTLLMVATSKVFPSAIGDLLYGYLIYFIVFGFAHPVKFLLFTFMVIISGLGFAGLQVIINSVAFFIPNGQTAVDSLARLINCATTYPGEIFKKGIQIFCYFIGTGFNIWLPHKILLNFDAKSLVIYVLFNLMYVVLAFKIFNLGLKHYSSSNFMAGR